MSIYTYIYICIYMYSKVCVCIYTDVFYPRCVYCILYKNIYMDMCQEKGYRKTQWRVENVECGNRDNDLHVRWGFPHIRQSYGDFQLVMGVPLDRWMVYFDGKTPSFEMDDDWGYPHFRNPPYIGLTGW